MNRKKEQLLQILQRSNDPITGKELSKMLDVSTRTIINYIKEFNRDSKEAFILSGQEGYYIDRSVSFESEETDGPQDRSQRMFHILKTLLLSENEGIDSFELADDMYISYSLLKKEIAQFNTILKPYDVSIVSRNNIITINGEEKAKRRVMTSFIQKDQGDNILNEEKLRQCFSEDLIDTISQIIKANVHNADAYINEFSRLNLLLHLSIVANRLMFGKQLNSENKTVRKISDRSEALSDHIISDVERAFHITMNAAEYAQMSALIQSHVHLGEPEGLSSGQKRENGLYEDVRSIMEEVYEKYYLDMLNDNFLVPFSLHIENLLLRLSQNILIENPIKETFRSSSPFLYDVALYIVERIKERYDVKEEVSDNELTFLVMHLALELERQKQDSNNVSCLMYFPKYLGMETSLVNKIRIHFEDVITIAGVIHSQDEIDDYDYDILISFVNADVPIFKKYVKISPLLSQADYGILNDAITAAAQEKLLVHFRKVFPLFFKEENVEIIKEESDKYSLLKRMSKTLQDNGYVTEGFVEKVIQREEAISTGYINFAVPHGVGNEVKEQTVAVAILPEGLEWSGRKVYCVMLMAVDPETLDEFQQMYNALLLLLMETDAVEQLKKITTFTDFRKTLLNTNVN
ncbi:MAG: PTS sugar transporter subunit IIA [Erysipelotrichaceae bacterium]|nr:PTS sugar transporter subunit IIA [Erysipelotrichaceae bacterium]